MPDRIFTAGLARVIACGLGVLSASVIWAGDASFDPFAPGSQSGFSTKNPTFARYAASEARGFDRVGKPVELEFVFLERPSVEGEPLPAEPKPEWLRAEPPQRTVVPLKLFNAGKSDQLKVLDRDPAGCVLPEPRSIGVFVGAYAEPSEDSPGAYWVELYYSWSALERWLQQTDAAAAPILSSMQLCSHVTVGGRWIVFGSGGIERVVDGVSVKMERALYLRVVDGLPPADPAVPLFAEPTKITPPASR